MKISRSTIIRKRFQHARNVEECYFCKSKTLPDYKQVEVLRRYLTDRGRVLAREYSGVCARHQRRLVKAISRARHLALLPFLAWVKK